MGILFITGGARSGKSAFALREAARVGGRKVYLATAEALDEEMAERIAAHRRDRDGSWETIEEPIDLPGALRRIRDTCDVIVVDCLTLWLSNLLTRHPRRSGEDALQAAAGLRRTLLELRQADRDRPHVFLVSNEVGMGIVPGDREVRRFRDIAGKLNQMTAEVADEVYLMVSGLPLKVSGEQPGAG